MTDTSNNMTAQDWKNYGGRDYGYTPEPTLMPTTTTAKATKRGIRVWLENKSKLESAGFHAGAMYDITTAHNSIALKVNANGACRVSSCKRGDAVRPIIDLHSKALEQVFTAGQALTVYYVNGAITIVGNK